MGFGWVASAFLAGWFLSPLLQTSTSPGTLDDIASWALQGPGRDIPTPLMGVWLFKGLNPSFLADISYAHSWNAKERSFILDMAGPGMHVVDGGTSSALHGEFAATSPTPVVTGVYLKGLMALMRHSNKFLMNEQGTRALIQPIFFFEGCPLNWLARAQLREEIEVHRAPLGLGPAKWKRVNYAPPANTTPAEPHYWLHPVVTRKPGGSAVVHHSGVRMAKRKLAALNATIIVH